MMNTGRKSKIVAGVLSFFLGYIGADRFYLGYFGMGLFKLFTGGGFGILALIDFIRILTGSLSPANGTPYLEDEQKQGSFFGSFYQSQPRVQEQPQQPVWQHVEARDAEPPMEEKDPVQALKDLYTLYEKGIITQSEYMEKKQKYIDMM